MKLFTRTYLPLLLLLLSLGSCIKDDLSDCPAGLKVYFEYTPATYARTGVDPKEVDRIDLYVFDAQGVFRGVWIDKTPDLNPDYHIVINNLPFNDTYRFIAWAGLHSHYSALPDKFIAGKTTYSDALLKLEHASGTIDTKINPLFHAEKSQYIDNNREHRVDMPLVQVYNTINLTTEGFSNNSKTYRMTVYDNNGKYNFDSSFASDSDFNYTSVCTKDTDGQLSATLNVLKLADDRTPIIEISDQDGTILFKENLVGLINAMGSNNYNNTHIYDIHLRFGLSVSVSVNGWWVVEDGVILK